jgi:hypothetical protein
MKQFWYEMLLFIFCSLSSHSFASSVGLRLDLPLITFSVKTAESSHQIVPHATVYPVLFRVENESVAIDPFFRSSQGVFVGFIFSPKNCIELILMLWGIGTLTAALPAD